MKKSSKKEYGLLVVILAIVSGLFVYYFSGSTSPVIPNYYGDDSAMFQVIGKSWTQGLVPYVGTFDHKGPFIFLVNALGYALGNYGMMVVQWIFIVTAFFAIFKIARLFLNYGYAVGVTLVSFGILAGTYGFGNYTEEYSLAFIAFSIYFGIKYFLQIDWEKKETLMHPWKYAIWYGIGFMCILLMRVTSALAICCLVVVVLGVLLRFGLWKNIFQNIGGFLLGMLVAFAPFAIYFLSKGALYDMIYGTLIHNVLYASNSSIFTEIGAAWRSAIIALFTTVLLAGVSVLYFFVEKRKNWLIAVYGLFVSVISMILFVSINRYLHYYMISVPYFAMVAGMTAKIWGHRKEHLMKKIICYMTIAGIGVQVLLGITRVQRQPYSNEIFKNYAAAYKNCVEDIMAEVQEEEKDDFLVFGSNALSQWYLVADVKPIYKYCFLQGWMSSCSDSIKAEVTEYLDKDPAKWLVLDADFDTEELEENYCPEFIKMIEEKYERVKVSKCQNDYKCFALYKRVK